MLAEKLSLFVFVFFFNAGFLERIIHVRHDAEYFKVIISFNLE